MRIRQSREPTKAEREQMMEKAFSSFREKINKNMSDEEFNKTFAYNDVNYAPGYRGQSSSVKLDGTPRLSRTRPLYTKDFQDRFRKGRVNIQDDLFSHGTDEDDILNMITGNGGKNKRRKTKKRGIKRKTYKKKGKRSKGKTVRFKGNIKSKK